MNNLNPLYIFDIDGTIADLTHRLHYIQNIKPDWKAFNSNVMDDAPIKNTIKTLKLLTNRCEIWFFTGRTEACRTDTENWLSANTGICFPNVTMRAHLDTRPDYTVKQEMYERMLVEDKARLIAVFDDRQQVVDMWRKNKVTCYQVAKGNY
jgi:phosphoglycolate phosphatase-like HAD superfamily hydrolase